MEIDGKITTHHQTIAEKFNNCYISVADKITNNNLVNITIGDLNKISPLNYLYSVFKQSLTNIKIKITTTHEIEKIIKELKSKRPCRYDEITTKVLKISSPFIVSPLTHIGSRMLPNRTFPDRIKFSEIKPVYKEVDKTLTTITHQFLYFLYFQKF